MRAACLASAVLLLLASAAASAHRPPSFSCDGRLTATERAICEDAELSAYDRALAFLYPILRRSGDATTQSQGAWLDKRNQCGERRDCLLAAYREWIGIDALTTDFGPELKRIEQPPPDGSDLLLGTLQSPTGEVTPLADPGSLSIRALGDGWHLFHVAGFHIYDPHDGLGPNVSDAVWTGLVRLENGEGRFTGHPGKEDGCTILFRALPDGVWFVDENGVCGGIGATVAGAYSP